MPTTRCRQQQQQRWWWYWWWSVLVSPPFPRNGVDSLSPPPLPALLPGTNVEKGEEGSPRMPRIGLSRPLFFLRRLAGWLPACRLSQRLTLFRRSPCSRFPPDIASPTPVERRWRRRRRRRKEEDGEEAICINVLWLDGCLRDWLVGGLTGWLAGWQAGWLVFQEKYHCLPPTAPLRFLPQHHDSVPQYCSVSLPSPTVAAPAVTILANNRRVSMRKTNSDEILSLNARMERQ